MYAEAYGLCAALEVVSCVIKGVPVCFSEGPDHGPICSDGNDFLCVMFLMIFTLICVSAGPSPQLCTVCCLVHGRHSSLRASCDV